VLKHGIKASGMPAWGKSMDDRYLWGMVAFMQQFPGMTAAQYSAQVSASDGHSHGGGETDVGGGDPHAGHDGANAERSSFEPVDDPMATPARDDHTTTATTLNHPPTRSCTSFHTLEKPMNIRMTSLALPWRLPRRSHGPRQ
jgi:hypothetical protein